MRHRKTLGAAGEVAEATRESYRTVVGRTFVARESCARVAWDFFERTVDELHDQTGSNLRAMQELTDHAYRQHETFLSSVTGYRAEPPEKENP